MYNWDRNKYSNKHFIYCNVFKGKNDRALKTEFKLWETNGKMAKKNNADTHCSLSNKKRHMLVI